MHYFDKSNVKIIAGELAFYADSDYEQTRQIYNFTLHPDFNIYNHQNDICVLALNEPFELNEHVQTLPFLGSIENIEEIVQDCKIAGWGALYEKAGRKYYPKSLFWANVTLDTKENCQTKIGDEFIADSMVCTKPGPGICTDDEGGPLVCNTLMYNNSTLVGIASWNSGNCHDITTAKTAKPSVFTKYSAHPEWIAKAIGEMEYWKVWNGSDGHNLSYLILGLALISVQFF